MKPVTKLLISIPLALLLCIGLSFAGFSKDCAALRKSVIRLHILANSDSAPDQSAKLAVRDSLLCTFGDVFADAENFDSARRSAEESLALFERKAAETLAALGLSQAVRAELVTEYFPTTDYGDRILPAGQYTAVRILLGNAEGKNWFCVAFPPLCLGASARQNGSTEAAVTFSEGKWIVTQKKGGYVLRFKLVEWLEKLRSGKDTH